MFAVFPPGEGTLYWQCNVVNLRILEN